MLALLFWLLFNSAQACDDVTHAYVNGQLVPVHVVHQDTRPVRQQTVYVAPAVRPRVATPQTVYVDRTIVVRRQAPAPQPTLTLGITTPTWSFVYAAPTPPPQRVQRTTTVTTTKVTRRR